MPLKRYADFQGRSRRMEFWMFMLGYFAVVVVMTGLALAMGMMSDFETGEFSAGVWVIFALLGLFLLAVIIPSIAVQVRRLHDQNLSGWWVLAAYVLSNVPFVGFLVSIAWLVVLCLPGTRGPNRFGPDPKDPYGHEDAAATFG
ncbi:DUF805 domain-containing protein [Sphingomonas sp. CJ99]